MFPLEFCVIAINCDYRFGRHTVLLLKCMKSTVISSYVAMEKWPKHIIYYSPNAFQWHSFEKEFQVLTTSQF